MKNLTQYITEYSQIDNDIDVSKLFGQGNQNTRYFMVYYGNNMLVDVVGYDAEDDITGDDERTTDKVTAKIWALKVGESTIYAKTIWTRIK